MKKSNLLTSKMSAMLAVVVLFASSCKKDDEGGDPPVPETDYSTGVLITNEGPFQTGTGTITHIDRTTGEVTQDLFNKVNTRSLGNIVHSATRVGDNIYIVVNNAEKIEVVNAKNFQSIGVINGLTLPRYVITNSAATKAYVSQTVAFGSNGNIAVVDVASSSVTKTIEVGVQPEQMVIYANSLFVINSSENTVSRIDLTTETVAETITVGDRPNSITLIGNKVWVLCGGTPDWAGDPTAGSLVAFDADNSANMSTTDFLSVDNHPKQLFKDGGGNLYYSYKGVFYKQASGAADLDTNTVVINRSFYNVGFDHANNTLYGSDAGDFTSNGWVYRYTHPGFAKKDSIKVGIIPGNFVF